MKAALRFLIFWVINSLLIYAANLAYPANFVLGSFMVSYVGAIVLAGFLLTLFCRISGPLVLKVGLSKPRGRYLMFLFYWGVNFVGIWLIARVAPYTGFGISAFYWALYLGFATNLLQWIVRQPLKVLRVVEVSKSNASGKHSKKR
jgi:uncharacterized membrane protein YvlD (DUF360 family)